MRRIIAGAVIPVIMIVMRSRVARRPVAAAAEEGHEHQAPGIEGGQAGGDVGAQEGIDRAVAVRGECRLDDRVLGNEAGKTERREGMPTPVSESVPIIIIQNVNGIALPQPAHLAHVLLVMHRGDHRARAEEQQRLEEGMGEEVEHAEAVAADAEADEHVAELRAGRIGDHPLDVVLDETRRSRRRTPSSRPTIVTTLSATGDISNSGESRATMNTPAVTMVAA